jgi:hypothetical protein
MTMPPASLAQSLHGHLVSNNEVSEMQIFLVSEAWARFSAVIASDADEAMEVYREWARFHSIPEARDLSIQPVTPAQLPGDQASLAEMVTWNQVGVAHLFPSGSWCLVMPDQPPEGG